MTSKNIGEMLSAKVNKENYQEVTLIDSSFSDFSDNNYQKATNLVTVATGDTGDKFAYHALDRYKFQQLLNTGTFNSIPNLDSRRPLHILAESSSTTPNKGPGNLENGGYIVVCQKPLDPSKEQKIEPINIADLFHVLRYNPDGSGTGRIRLTQVRPK